MWAIALPFLLGILIIIILYAFGYRYDFKEKKIYPTSVLSISSSPLGAKVILDDKYKGLTKTTVKNLKPGTYKLKLSKEGFIDWETQVEITPYSFIQISPFLFYKNPVLEKEFTFDEILDFKKGSLLVKKDKKIYYKEKDNEPIEIKNINGAKKIFLGENSLVAEYKDFWKFIKNSSEEINITKPQKEIFKKIIFRDKKVYLLNNKDELWEINNKEKKEILKNVIDFDDNNERLLIITKDNKLFSKNSYLVEEKASNLEVKNDSRSPISINSLKFCNFETNTPCLFSEKQGFFILVNNSLYWLSNQIKDLKELNKQLIWLDSEGNIYLFKNGKIDFVNRYFTPPSTINFISENYILLHFEKEIRIVELQTKQEFKILATTNNIVSILPLSNYQIILITNKKEEALKIGENLSPVEYIIKILKR